MGLAAIQEGAVELRCSYTGRPKILTAKSVVLVTARTPNDALYNRLLEREGEFNDRGVKSLQRIGDALAPGTIAAAVYSGHRLARELEENPIEGIPFRMERRPIEALRS